MPNDDACIAVDDDDIIEAANLDAECIETTVPRIRMMGAQGPQRPEELDTQTLLDLGVAYREMGQLGSAIRHFRQALAVETKQVYCHMMIALCLLDQDRIEEAIAELKNGLYLNQITELEALALQYELAMAHERLGQVQEALFYYRRVRRLSPRFRNATARLTRLTFRLRAAPRSRPVAAASERRWPPRLTSFGRLLLRPTG